MAINQLIAKKYAVVAFNLAKKNNFLDQFLWGLRLFSESFSDDMVGEFANPAISRLDLAKIITEIGEKLMLNQQLIIFLGVVVDSRRINLIKTIEQHFIHLVKVERKILEVEIVSSTKLDEEVVENIKCILSKKHQDLVLEIKQTIKKDILGGLIIKIGNTVIDASLKGQINGLKNYLI